MRTDRDYYRILGIERSATPDQIKQRYRELVRQHHPDVSPNQHAGLGHNTFLQIVEAYQLLSDPDKRREYDKVWERRSATQTAASAGPATQTAQGGNAVIATLLSDATRYFEAKNYGETGRTCRRILQLDKENPEAYELLGDVYAAMKRNEMAVSHYTMAQQFTQKRKSEVGVKIDNLMKRQEKDIHEAIHGKPVYKRAPVIAIASLTLLMLALWGMSLRDSPPIEAFAFLDQTPFRTLMLFWMDAFLLGLLLAGSGALERYDDEMLFDLGAGQSPKNAPPIGLMIPVISILNFYLAVIAGIIYGLMNEKFSTSFVKAALGLFLLGLAFAAPHPNALTQVLLFGTGPAFAIMCAGWLISDVIRPHW
ncbi:MAG: DnaJ domain-containing protein [Armatimonadetes bacterium]|nr:DnaJ domain-containing protein [Armatimonadota bacterium]